MGIKVGGGAPNALAPVAQNDKSLTQTVMEKATTANGLNTAGHLAGALFPIAGFAMGAKDLAAGAFKAWNSGDKTAQVTGVGKAIWGAAQMGASFIPGANVAVQLAGAAVSGARALLS